MKFSAVCGFVLRHPVIFCGCTYVYMCRPWIYSVLRAQSMDCADGACKPDGYDESSWVEAVTDLFVPAMSFRHLDNIGAYVPVQLNAHILLLHMTWGTSMSKGTRFACHLMLQTRDTCTCFPVRVDSCGLLLIGLSMSVALCCCLLAASGFSNMEVMSLHTNEYAQFDV